MADPYSYDVYVWDSKRPERPTRARNNPRTQIMFPRVSRQPVPVSSASASTSTLGSTSHSGSYEHMESRTSHSPQPTIIDELKKFSTCEISDALIKSGLTHNALDAPVQRGGFIPDIQMMSPSPNDLNGQTKRICGFAYTVKLAFQLFSSCCVVYTNICFP